MFRRRNYGRSRRYMGGRFRGNRFGSYRGYGRRSRWGARRGTAGRRSRLTRRRYYYAGRRL